MRPQNSKLGTRNSELLRLPSLPDGAAEATVEAVYVATGEQVRRGQPLVLVRTERFAYDIPAAASGTLAELRVEPGQRLGAGQPLALVRSAEPAAGVATSSGPAGSTAADAPPVRATPLARKVAAAFSVDLALLAARTRGIVRRDDVLRVVDASAAATGAAAAAIPIDPGAPTALTALEVDWSATDAYIAQQTSRRARSGPRPDRRACLASAVAGALLHHHLLCAAWSEDAILARRRVDLQIGERFVGAAADLNALGIARVLAEQDSSDVKRAAFHIVERDANGAFEAALPDGSSAALYVGRAERRLRVVDSVGERFAPRPVSVLALVYDARVLDQRSADSFLLEVRNRVERLGSLC